MPKEKKPSAKYNTPLAVTHIIQKYALNFEHIVERMDFDGLLKLVHKDPESDFFFAVKDYRLKENQVFITIEYKPRSSIVPATMEKTLKLEEVDPVFSKWMELVKAYAETTLFGDAKILQAYEDEYFASFEIVDEDAATNPFPLKQVFLLDNHLEEVGQKVQILATEMESGELEEIAKDIDQLRDQLTSKPKKWVMKRVANVWAKITKQGPRVVREILSESKTESIKQMIKTLITHAPDLIP